MSRVETQPKHFCPTLVECLIAEALVPVDNFLHDGGRAQQVILSHRSENRHSPECPEEASSRVRVPVFEPESQVLPYHPTAGDLPIRHGEIGGVIQRTKSILFGLTIASFFEVHRVD